MECKNVKVELMVNVKMATLSAKFLIILTYYVCTEKRINTSLKDHSITLNNHGWHDLLSCFSSLPISVLRKGYFHLCPRMDFLQFLHINNSLYTNYENVFIELDS